MQITDEMVERAFTAILGRVNNKQTMRIALEAGLSAVMPAQVSVKPLEWEDNGSALTVLGSRYSIYQEYGRERDLWACNRVDGIFEDAEAAKAAAQADYEARIRSTLSAQVQEVAGEHVAWRLRHKNDGPHMWEYYQLPEAEASDNVVIQKLTIKQLIDILNDDKHAGAQERPPEPHSPNASVPIDLLQKIWAEMYYGVGGEGGIDDSIAQWNLNEVVDILAMAGALPASMSPQHSQSRRDDTCMWRSKGKSQATRKPEFLR